MKSITFIRHAKSSCEFNLSDKKRPLNKRGLFDVNFMSSLELIKSFKPEAVFCSTALRTQETCHFFLKNDVFQVDIVTYTDALYVFDYLELQIFITTLSPQLSKVFIIGHNHALTALVNQLGEVAIENIPTCGIVKINFKSSSWNALKNGQVEFQLFPKNLMP